MFFNEKLNYYYLSFIIILNFYKIHYIDDILYVIQYNFNNVIKKPGYMYKNIKEKYDLFKIKFSS